MANESTKNAHLDWIVAQLISEQFAIPTSKDLKAEAAAIDRSAKSFAEALEQIGSPRRGGGPSAEPE